jgi:hypothetical protein
MSRPNELVDLLEELTPDPNSVGTIESSKAVVAYNSEEITLTAEECEQVFKSAKAIKQLLDALGAPKKVTLELHGVELTDRVQEFVERTFTSVDEI